MFLRNLSASLNVINGIGEKTLPALARLGINNVAQLLLHYPRDWEDTNAKVPLMDFRLGKVRTEVTVLAKDWIIRFGKPPSPKFYVQDESGRAVLLSYNQPWDYKKYIVGERYRLSGVFSYNNRGELQANRFEAEPVGVAPTDTSVFSGGILPVYPSTAGIEQKQLRKFIYDAIQKFAGKLSCELPPDIIKRDGLFPKAQAIKSIHFPASAQDLERAKKTLLYEELFYLEIMVGKRALQRKGIKKNAQADAADVSKKTGFSPLQKRLIERLPFSLTAGQEKAVFEINIDLDAQWLSMARLLQGDVGCGKTLVSFLAALRAIEAGGQVALMAPTELLARQHAENAAALLEPLGLHIAFLTGNIKAAGRRELLRNLAAGDIDIVIGTHALFSADVRYKNLTLVVIDEQHRFGVTQRAHIMAKAAQAAGLLMMSATPIPRTLALTIFGDMDVSTIADMPQGRLPVKTHLAKESNEGKVYDYVRKQLVAGRQAYFVYPLIKDGEDIKDLEVMSERLAREIFPDFTVASIHSKVGEEQKQKTMADFRSGAIDILAATSVVEVGVDVPNATCMVVEHAERFGLSALHQLRGRVGRGRDQAYCFLVYSDDLSDDGVTRMKIMLQNSDGFIIAEEDLKMRGPGQFAGTEQSGYIVLGLAHPVRDIEELARARDDAFFILENDPDLLLEGNKVVAQVLEEAPPWSEVAF
ncbi:MAG: ATP-dependent DNA helicase RecG [Spirochaetes bacterium]|nr:ATP-dependent DNA helicase RecG [Spirochaetota bacterium]